MLLGLLIGISGGIVGSVGLLLGIWWAPIACAAYGTLLGLFLAGCYEEVE